MGRFVNEASYDALGFPMDAFVVRTPRDPKCPKVVPNSATPSRQRRLSDLKGVVVNLDRQVEQLKDQGTKPEDKIRILKGLLDKTPSTDLIVSSGIGKVIRHLSKTQDNREVQKLASKLKRAWTQIIESRVEAKHSKDKPEVRSDLETTRTRCKARDFFKQVLPSEDEARALEKKIYDHHRPVVSSGYKRTVRTVYLALKGGCKELGPLLAKHSIR